MTKSSHFTQSSEHMFLASELDGHGDFNPEQVISNILERETESEKYIIDQKVAQGGMGAIYQVFDRDLQRTSVLKVILPGIITDAFLFRRFIQEARITGQLEHPNVVPVHELGVLGNNKLYFSMKYVLGEALGTILRKVRDGNKEYIKKFPRYTLLTIFRKVCDAAAYAHSKDIIHRDIKPDNIMVGDYGEVLLMDWGLARQLSQEPKEDAPKKEDQEKGQSLPDSSLTTRFGVVKGTPTYMSPEQAKGCVNEIDKRSDIFLLGSTLYAIVTFQVPYTGNDVYEILANAENGNYIKPGEKTPELEIPEELCRIIEKSMAYNPNDRYQCVEDLSKDLDALMAGNTVSIRKRFNAGDYLMREEEPGHEAYVILKGAVDVTKKVRGEPLKLITLNEGDIIGEMALILEAPRSATVQAALDTEVVVITEETMKQGLGQLPPWMGKVVDSLAGRLRNANTNVHPLLNSDCTYHVLNQLRLLYCYWVDLEPSPETNALVPVVNTSKIVQEISLNLSITKEKTFLLLSLLFESNLLSLIGDDKFYIPDFDLFSQFVNFSRIQIGIETGFETEKCTSFFANNGEIVIRHSCDGKRKKSMDCKENIPLPSEKLKDFKSSKLEKDRFAEILNQLREINNYSESSTL